jgi:predicted RNA-binding protein with TRAM domain
VVVAQSLNEAIHMLIRKTRRPSWILIAGLVFMYALTILSLRVGPMRGLGSSWRRQVKLKIPQLHQKNTLLSASARLTSTQRDSRSSSSHPAPPPPLAIDSIIQLNISELTSQGDGFARYKPSGRDDDSNSVGWVVMIPNALPNETVTCRIVENQKSYRLVQI